MTTEKKHELARLVMEVIAPNQNFDLEEFVLSIIMLKTEQKLCDFVLELFNDDDEKLRCIQKIESFVDENNGDIFLSDLQLESDISFKVIGNLHATICELSDVVFINLDKSLYDEYDNFEQVGTWVNYGDLPLDTLKELCGVLEKYKK